MVAGALTLTKSTRQAEYPDSPDEPTCSPQQTSDSPDYPGRWPGPGQPVLGPPRDSLRALRLLDRPLGQHAGEVLFVFRAGAQDTAWVEPARRVRVRDDPAYRAHVADLVVHHLACHLGEQGQLVLHYFRVLDGHVPRQRADAQLLPVLIDVVQVLDAVDVDQRAWLREAQPHQRDEAVPTRQHLRILPVFAEQLGCLLD